MAGLRFQNLDGAISNTIMSGISNSGWTTHGALVSPWGEGIKIYHVCVKTCKSCPETQDRKQMWTLRLKRSLVLTFSRFCELWTRSHLFVSGVITRSDQMYMSRPGLSVKTLEILTRRRHISQPSLWRQKQAKHDVFLILTKCAQTFP